MINYSITDKPQQNGRYSVLKNGMPLKTPGGKLLANESAPLLRKVVRELQKGQKEDPSKLSLFSMLCTQLDHMEHGTKSLEENMEAILLDDIALRTCAGPEVIAQLEAMSFLLEYLSGNSLEHPSLAQSIDGAGLKKLLKNNGGLSLFAKLVEHFRQEWLGLSAAERCVVVNAASVHGSIVLGFMLVRGLCSLEAYGNALAAANCLLSDVWSGITKAGSKRYQASVRKDAKLMMGFLKLQQPVRR